MGRGTTEGEGGGNQVLPLQENGAGRGEGGKRLSHAEGAGDTRNFGVVCT